MSLKRVRQRRSASITSLIDVIFLLLLFFMLASTFSRQAEIELVSGREGASVPVPDDVTVLRLVIEAGALRLDETPVALDGLAAAVSAQARAGETILAVDPGEAVTTQRLVDVLLALRGATGVRIQIVEPSP
jgi:biopolymer transport protein ExbD